MFIGTVIKQFSIKEGLQDQSVIHFHLESPTMKTLLIAFVLLVVTLATAAPAAKQSADTPAERQIPPWLHAKFKFESENPWLNDRTINVGADTPAERQINVRAERADGE